MAIPPAICVTDATSWNVSPSNSTGSDGRARQRGDPERRAVDRVVGLPRPRGVPGAPAERPDAR